MCGFILWMHIKIVNISLSFQFFFITIFCIEEKKSQQNNPAIKYGVRDVLNSVALWGLCVVRRRVDHVYVQQYVPITIPIYRNVRDFFFFAKNSLPINS